MRTLLRRTGRTLTAVVLLGLLALPPDLRAAEPEPIAIAALFNLTGGGQDSLDRPALDGLRLKARQINAAGGLLGGRRIEIHVFDSRNDVKRATANAKRAVTLPHLVAGIGYGDTNYALAAAPAFQAARIPFVTSGATAPTLPTAIGDEMFLVPFGDDVQAHAMAAYAYDALGLRTIAVWTDEAMDYAKGLSGYFRQRFDALGGRIIVADVFHTTDTDLSALVANLKAHPEAQAVFAASGPDTAGEIVKQIRTAGLALPILAGDGFDTDLLVRAAGKTDATNVYFTTHAFVDVDTPLAKAFRRAYAAAYGQPPESAFAALGYDALGLVADAIRRAGSTDPEAVRKALAATKDLAAVTGAITYAAGSRVPLKPVAIMSVDHGKVTLKTTVTPRS